MWTMKECQDRDALMKKVQEECAVDKERINKRWADEECVRRNALSTRRMCKMGWLKKGRYKPRKMHS